MKNWEDITISIKDIDEHTLQLESGVSKDKKSKQAARKQQKTAKQAEKHYLTSLSS